MNYFPLINLKLKEFSELVPDYTLGQILYSALNLKYEGKSFSKGDLFDVTDEEFYGLLSRALVREQDDIDEEIISTND